MFNKLFKGTVFAIAAATLAPASAIADSIDPASYADTLAIGGSVTIRKTVTITKESPTTAPLDVMFVFDVTGSMGGEIATAKAAANDILTGLAGFGSLRSGTGWYADPTYDGVASDLTATDATTVASIDGYGACTVGGTYSGALCGGDFPESGYAAISDAADNASWAPGSNRFIIVFGDASFKTPPSAAATTASLAAADAELIGISYDSSFSSDITDLGGTAYSGFGLDASGLAATILASIGTSFDTYSSVTVDDFGAGLPGVGVSVDCISADTGACVGADAVGSYDRSVDRTFEYDVTFTGLADGVYDFGTHGVVDGGIVATERDRITIRSASVPAPGILGLLSLGLIGIAGATRRRS